MPKTTMLLFLIGAMSLLFLQESIADKSNCELICNDQYGQAQEDLYQACLTGCQLSEC